MCTVEKIIQELDAKGIKPSVMMKDLGFSSGLFSQWKSGSQNPSTEKLEKISEYLGCSVDYLLGADENPANEYYRRLQTLTPEQRLLLENMMCEFEHLNSQNK